MYDIGLKGVAFCSSSRASSSSVTAAVDEAFEQRVMETNERIAVMETEMKEKDQQITLLKDEMQQMKEVNNEMKDIEECNATTDDQYVVTVSGLDATDGTPSSSRAPTRRTTYHRSTS